MSHEKCHFKRRTDNFVGEKYDISRQARGTLNGVSTSSYVKAVSFCPMWILH